MKDTEHLDKDKLVPEVPAEENVGVLKAFSGQPDDLHNLFSVNASTTDAEDDDPLAELRKDPNYSALLRDLEYIAKQARLLFEPAQEAPSDEVWSKIQSQLGAKPPEA